MFTFRWKVLESCNANDSILAAWEISAIFRQECSIEDISIDRDAAVDAYINDVISDDEKEDFRQEPQHAEDQMLEAFSSDLRSMVEERMAILGKHYPFTFEDGVRLVSRPAADRTAVGGAYLTLQFYRCWTTKLIEIEEQNDQRRKTLETAFNLWFPKAFEIIAGYAVSGDKSGIPHVTAHCRSSLRLHQMLTSLCLRLESGRVRQYAEWSLPQQQSNDGGIDCIVHVGGPRMPGNANLVLVGATVQKTQIEHKIVGEDVRRRFSDFFAERPGAFQGALVRPGDADALTIAKCRDRDCLLYSYTEIWQNIGRRVDHQASVRPFRVLDGRLRRKLRMLNGAILCEDYTQHTLQI